MCLQRNVYVKGLVAEVAEFLFGEGFAIAGGDLWRARRRAVGPSLHKWVLLNVRFQFFIMFTCSQV